MRKVLQKILIVIAVIAAGAALFSFGNTILHSKISGRQQIIGLLLLQISIISSIQKTGRITHSSTRMCLRLRWTGIRYERWKSKQSGEIGIFRLSL